MSKTYRRTRKGRKIDWLPNIHKRDLVDVWFWGFKLFRDQKKREWLENNPHREKDVGDYFYWMTTPSHWNRDRHTKPRRARERELLHKVKCGKTDPENVSWPTGKKPMIYYW